MLKLVSRQKRKYKKVIYMTNKKLVNGKAQNFKQNRSRIQSKLLKSHTIFSSLNLIQTRPMKKAQELK